MLSFFDKGRRKKALAVAVAAFTVMALAGCSKGGSIYVVYRKNKK